MDEIYYDPKRVGSYGGIRSLWSNLPTKRSLSEVKNWLRNQDAYTLHRGIRQRFPRRTTEVASEGQQLQADLLDIRSHSEFNDGNNFILTCVDVFSRKAWAVPIRSKSAAKVAEALQQVLKDEKYMYLQTDKGKEFYNETVRHLLQSKGIKHFSSENETIKASIVERFNKTVREKIHRYLTAKNTKRFLHVLPDIIDTYNRTRHSTTGVAPINVGPHNREDINQRLYLSWREDKGRENLRVGDFVRITKYRGAFKRGYTPNWTHELFVIKSKDIQTQPPTYKIKDQSGEEIEGSFYEEELQKVGEPESYKIEKVIRSRRQRNGQRQYFVKWMGYPDSFNSWVNESDFVE